MGCCASRVKDKKNHSFEESQDDETENPLNILSVSGTPKRSKIFKKIEKSRDSVSIPGDTLDLEEKEITTGILYSLRRSHPTLRQDSNINININVNLSTNKRKSSYGKNEKASQLNSSGCNDSSFFNSSDISLPFIKSYTNSVISASPQSSPKKAEKDYFSICSHKFQSEQTREVGLEDDFLNTCNFEIGTKSYATLFYFELDYLMLWSKEYLKSTYPELNLILIITLDDQPANSEKIYLTKTIESQKYTPLLKKEDFQSNKKNFRFLKFVQKRPNEIHKIQLDLATFCKGKLVIFSSEEIFVNLKNEVQRHKYTMYQNINMRYSKKKIANVLFSFIFQKESNNMTLSLNEKSRFLNEFQKVVDFSTLEDSPCSEYMYYSIPNLKLHDSKTIKEDNKNFLSINDIEEAEYNSGMKELKINADKLLQYISKVRKKYDLYYVMRSLYSSVTKKEFDESKLVSYQEKLVLRLEEFYHEVNGDNSAEILDKVTIPYIFENLRNIFLKFIKNIMKNKKSKNKKEPSNNFSMMSQDDSIIDKSSAFDYELRKKFVELLIKSVFIGFDILLLHENLEKEVVVSFLNFLCKVIDENFELECELDKIEANFKYSEDLFLHLIQNKSVDALLWSLLRKSDNEGISLYITSILAKLIKKNHNCMTLTSVPNYEGMVRHIFSAFGNNSLIMTNLFSIFIDESEKLKSLEFFELVSIYKVKEIFLNFTLNNFDLIHESLLHFIKTFIMKNKNYPMTSNNYSDLINLFSCALVLMKNKTNQSDSEKIYKWFFNMMTVKYTIVNIVSSFIKNSDNINLIEKICRENKLIDLLIDAFTSFCDKSIFTQIDKYNDRLDNNSINLKSIIMRTMYHTVILIKNLKIEKITRYYAERIYRLIKNIEESDTVFNPMSLLSDIEKNYKKFKNKEKFENLLGLQRNLLEYYSRYKSILPEFILGLVKLLKSSQ